MKPNFLFIITDQHRADDLGCYGNRIVATPNIDALAARGVTMDRAYVATPVCMPNRSTLMTGRLPSLHGVRSNGISLSLDSVTFADLLGAAGYRTALIGKSHLQNMTGLKALVAPQGAAGQVAPPAGLAEARHRADGDYLQEDLPRWRSAEDFGMQLPFYGFQHVDLAIGHGDEVDGHYGRWLRETAPELDRARRGPTDRVGPGRELVQSWDTPLPESMYPTTYLADRTEALLEAYAADPDTPFFLYCAFPDPHHPFTPPGRYRDMFRPEDMPLPETWQQPFHEAPPSVQWLRDQRDAGKAVKHTPALYACTEREAREATALTYGMIAMLDDAIGRIVATLERTGLSENTIIVFTTDHGDYLGEHQLMLKGPVHYQSLIRTPLIWSDPHSGRAGVRSDALTGTLDLAHTLLDRAGVAPANGMQGKSLLPVLDGRSDTHHDAVLIEDEVQRVYLGFEQPVRMRTLVTPRYRFSVYLDADWGELYDLRADPGEMRNLWADPAHRDARETLFSTLTQKMIAAADRSRQPTHMA